MKFLIGSNANITVRYYRPIRFKFHAALITLQLVLFLFFKSFEVEEEVELGEILLSKVNFWFGLIDIIRVRYASIWEVFYVVD